MAHRPIAVSVGGSVLVGQDLDTKNIRAIADTLDAQCPQPLGLVVGGGVTARRYIRVARDLGLDESGLDHVGINLTRANAWLLIAAFQGKAYPRPAESFEEAALAIRSFDRVCMGGTHPGHTTDAVAAMLAERLGAERLVIVTNVDGVYTADPKKDPGAELLEELTAEELMRIAGSTRSAGSAGVVDPLAAQIILRSHIATRVVGGQDVANVARAVAGKGFKGTTVTSK